MKLNEKSLIPLLVVIFLLFACGNNQVSQQQTVDQSIPQQQIVEQTVPQQQIVDQSVPQQQIVEQSIPQQQIVEQSIPQQQGINQQPMQTQIPQQNVGMQQTSISLDNAKSIAVTHAGFNVANVTFVKTIQDYDDGFIKWEIEFVNGNNKYEYEINAYDGSIMKSEIKQISYNQGMPQQGGMPQTQGIDIESAKSIAVTNAGYNVANVTFTKTKYDFDDGMAKWEIEFVANNQKYEYEIAVANGTIIESKVESIFYD